MQIEGSSRKILLIILAILAVVLLAVAVVIGIKLQQGQTPSTTATEICCGIVTCTDGRTSGSDCRSTHATCQARADQFCGAGKVTNAGNSCPASCGSTTSSSSSSSGVSSSSSSSSSGAAGCTNQYVGTTSFHLCPSATPYQIKECACPTSTGGSFPSCACTENCVTTSVTVTNPAGQDFSVAVPSCGTVQKEVSVLGGGICAGAGKACAGSSSSSSSSSSSGASSSSSSSSGAVPPCGDGVRIAAEECDPAASPTGCGTGQTCESVSCTCTTPTASAASCGETCDPANGDLDCDQGLSCDSSTSKCVLDACLGAATCTNNGCSLPDTAIISDTMDRILIGGLLLILGLLAVKFGWISYLEDMLVSINGGGKWAPRAEDRLVEHTRHNYEDKFRK